jgi:hypothetical protein
MVKRRTIPSSRAGCSRNCCAAMGARRRPSTVAGSLSGAPAGTCEPVRLPVAVAFLSMTARRCSAWSRSMGSRAWLANARMRPIGPPLVAGGARSRRRPGVRPIASGGACLRRLGGSQKRDERPSCPQPLASCVGTSGHLQTASAVPSIPVTRLIRRRNYALCH